MNLEDAIAIIDQENLRIKNINLSQKKINLSFEEAINNFDEETIFKLFHYVPYKERDELLPRLIKDKTINDFEKICRILQLYYDNGSICFYWRGGDSYLKKNISSMTLEMLKKFQKLGKITDISHKYILILLEEKGNLSKIQYILGDYTFKPYWDECEEKLEDYSSLFDEWNDITKEFETEDEYNEFIKTKRRL